MTLAQAKSLQYGNVILYQHAHNADGSLQRWRVNGAVKLWKKNPNRVSVPLKYGMGYNRNSFGYLTEDNLGDFEVCQ